jgi:hypothetical protein
LHHFPDLDTARIHFRHDGIPMEAYFLNEETFSDNDSDEQTDLQMEAVFENRAISSTLRCQLAILHSLSNPANIYIKHLYIHGLYLLPTTKSVFFASRRFAALFSGLRSLSIDTTSESSDAPHHAFEDFYFEFWQCIGKLLAGAALHLMSLSFTSDHYNPAPCEGWDAMAFPSLTTLKFGGFEFSDGSDFNDGVDQDVEVFKFLQRHLQEGSLLAR